MSTPHHRLSRVLMTADAVGGIWTYALGLAAGLAEAGVAVELAILGPPPDDQQRRAAAAIPGLRLHESALKLEWMEDAAADVARAADWLLALAARTGPELVHLNGYAHAVLPFGVPKLVVAHSCVRSWWRAVHGEDPPSSWDGYTRGVTAGLAAADHVVAPSGAMLAALVDAYGPLRPPASVIPNGLPPIARAPARKREVVLAAGRLWDAAKNIATLVAVADRLPWPIWIAGDGAPGEGRAAELPGVVTLGRLDAAAMGGAYADASIYALPARYEPFGLSILEAAQHGCALVLGDIPSLRENWDGAALFVDPADPGALAERLAGLIADPAGPAAWGARARTRAADFSLARTCAAVLDLYTRLTGAHAAAVTGRSPHKEIAACAS